MDDGFATITTLVVGLVLGIVLGDLLATSDWERDAVDRGLALYCPLDGNWAWQGECDA